MRKQKPTDLPEAIMIAYKAHNGQIDKGGRAYISHPMAVMRAVEGDDAKIVAVLHDVLEDTPVTAIELIARGVSSPLVKSILSVTRRRDETYFDFIRRAAADPIGRQVKLADIRHNMKLSRIPNPKAKDYRRLAKYAAAWLYLRFWL